MPRAESEAPTPKTWEVEFQRKAPSTLPYILSAMVLGGLIGVGIEQSKVL